METEEGRGSPWRVKSEPVTRGELQLELRQLAASLEAALESCAEKGARAFHEKAAKSSEIEAQSEDATPPAAPAAAVPTAPVAAAPAAPSSAAAPAGDHEWAHRHMRSAFLMKAEEPKAKTTNIRDIWKAVKDRKQQVKVKEDPSIAIVPSDKGSSRPPPGRLALPGLMESADDAAEDLQSVSTPVRNDPVDEAEDVKDEGPERMKSRRAGTGKMEKFWDPLVQRVNTQNEKDVEEVLVETRIYEMIVFAWPLEYLSLSAIILNAIVIGLETDIMSQQLLTDPPHEFVILGWVFCTFFTLEMVLKISANPSRFFTGTGWQMNVFDLVLVALQWLDVLLTALAADDQNQNTTNFNVMRVIRMVRLVRIVRSYRVLRMLGEVRAIVWSVGTSFKPLLGAMLVLAGVIYLMAVYLVDTCNAYRVTLGSADPGFEPLGQFFGSVPGGMLTLWQAMTGGIDWSTVMNPLLAYTSPLAVIIFLFYIAFSLLALLNLITGVFVESAVKRGKEDKDSYLVQYVRGVFKKMEKSNSGIITWDDFQASLHSKDIKELFKAIDLDISEAHCVFKILDLDDDGTLDADEFLSGCLRLRGPAKALDVLVLMREIRTMQTQLMERMSAVRPSRR